MLASAATRRRFEGTFCISQSETVNRRVVQSRPVASLLCRVSYTTNTPSYRQFTTASSTSTALESGVVSHSAKGVGNHCCSRVIENGAESTGFCPLMTEYGASGGDGMDAKERELHTKNGTSVESDKGVMSRSDASPQVTSRGPSASPQTGGQNSEEMQASRPIAQQDSGSSQPEVVAIDHRSPPALIEATGMNAKARRAAKRAAERTDAEAGEEAPTTAEEPNATKGGDALVVASSTKQTTVSGTKPTTAKERRAARRAVAREALTTSAVTTNTGTNRLSTSVSSETVPHAVGTGDYSSNSNKEGITSKERRLLRRQEERKKREREGEADQAEFGTFQQDSCLAKRRRLSGGGGGTSGSNPHIVFVGQLAFKTSAKDLEDHFKTRGGVTGKISVRLLTRKGTNPPRSRGMAFVEVNALLLLLVNYALLYYRQRYCEWHKHAIR